MEMFPLPGLVCNYAINLYSVHWQTMLAQLKTIMNSHEFYAHSNPLQCQTSSSHFSLCKQTTERIMFWIIFSFQWNSNLRYISFCRDFIYPTLIKMKLNSLNGRNNTNCECEVLNIQQTQGQCERIKTHGK